MRDTLNRASDRFIRPTVEIARRRVSSFQVCGYTGLAAALTLSTLLVLHRGLSPWVMAGLSLSAMATFLTLAMITKIVTGREQLIYYHQEVAVVAVAAMLLRAFDQPVLAYLDATLLGVGAFLACGRVGCTMVGCCHGRPYPWGVRYRHEHAKAGFTPYYVGIRLFPVQLVEAAWVVASVAVGSWMVLRGFPPGEAFAWYVVTYDVGRFCFEFLRGDPARPYLLGFSEGQWTSLLLLVLVVGLEAGAILVFHPWHLAATLAMAGAMVAIHLRRRAAKVAKHELESPRHVREVAGVLAASRAAENGAVGVGRTSLGIRISAGTVAADSDPVHHYTFSCGHDLLTEEAAEVVAGIVRGLRHPDSEQELTGGSRGIFHLLVHPIVSSGTAVRNVDR